jgi:hypothetical protein
MQNQGPERKKAKQTFNVPSSLMRIFCGLMSLRIEEASSNYKKNGEKNEFACTGQRFKVHREGKSSIARGLYTGGQCDLCDRMPTPDKADTGKTSV